MIVKMEGEFVGWREENLGLVGVVGGLEEEGRVK